MTMPKTKTLLKYAVIAYLVYLIYSLPKKDWSKGTVISEVQDSGAVTRYVPQQSAYYKYAAAWWRTAFKQKGVTGIIDENILAPMGITFDEEEKEEEKSRYTNRNSTNNNNGASIHYPTGNTRGGENATGTVRR